MAVAFVAAYMLVLQSALGALAFGGGPQAAQIDAFGNVICTHSGAAELPAGGQQPQHLPDCCAFGCVMSGATSTRRRQAWPFRTASSSRRSPSRCCRPRRPSSRASARRPIPAPRR